nr:immunoglobulin heavy chain junction region [Mus musculus]
CARSEFYYGSKGYFDYW